MITQSEWCQAKRWASAYVSEAGIPLRPEELQGIEVVDCGLGDLSATGLQILTLLSTPWVGARLLILRPHQFFPQHRHPPSASDGYPGKEETFRGQCGELYLYVPGAPCASPMGRPPVARRAYCTVWHEVVLRPGDQYTCPPNTWHWFQAGPEGCIVWSFSSRVTDAQDQFADPAVVRETRIISNTGQASESPC